MIDELDARGLLAAARGAEDAETRRAAQRRLTQVAGLQAARAVLDGSDEARLASWKTIGRAGGIAPAAVPYVGAALEGAPAKVAEDALGWLRNVRADEQPDEVRLAIARLAAAQATAVPLRVVMGAVEWGLEDRARWLRDAGPVADAFTAAGVAALDGVTAERLEDVRWSGGWQRVLARAPEDAGAAAATDRLLATPAIARLVAIAWFDAHGQLDRAGGAERLVAMAGGAWERAAARDREEEAIGAATGHVDALADALAEATARTGSHNGVALADWAWRRLCDHPDERARIYRAFRPWRDAMIERRNATPRERRPGGGSAVEHLAVWGALDLDRIGATLDEAVRLARPADWPALVSTMLGLVDGATTATDRVWALVGFGQLGHQLRNRVLDRDAGAGPDVLTAAATWRDHARAIARALREDGAVLDRDLANRADDFESTIELLDREDARRSDEAEAAASETERLRAELRRRHDDAMHAQQAALRQRDELVAALQAQNAQLAAQNAQLAARAQTLAAQLAAAIATGGAAPPDPEAPPRLEPRGPADPIDREPFFSHLALPTLVDYARAMVRLQRGADVMALFDELGLDATAWSACVQAWSTQFQARPDLAGRFAALLSGPWA